MLYIANNGKLEKQSPRNARKNEKDYSKWKSKPNYSTQKYLTRIW